MRLSNRLESRSGDSHVHVHAQACCVWGGHVERGDTVELGVADGVSCGVDLFTAVLDLNKRVNETIPGGGIAGLVARVDTERGGKVVRDVGLVDLLHGVAQCVDASEQLLLVQAGTHVGQPAQDRFADS
ncbi:hypothetical protein OGAPHI_000926 [Ogataea philodendri]|uniref:Uncharacterized protein n=1 Tax=Ogataea philodendri TaxID=1378263 RepID=A0A9P8T924_9ASCO|nr:uncharacterized protein OGAPHI_000926 [Ogataea philodendri]KAH3670411.1 hypothetical protein OGAPHI_000926 [Ogataea philodendri]